MIKGKCKLCYADSVDLRESHIIPEFVYKPVYDSKHRFIDFTEDPEASAEFVQKGVRENLLCDKCELLLSVYENKLSDFIVEINTNSGNTITQLPNSKAKLMKNIRYNDVKIALLSILYRMSVSKRDQFNGYSLGPYENDFRRIILNNEFTDTYTFSIHISPVTMGGIYYPDMIMTCGNKSIYNSIYTSYCFVIYGLLVDIMVSKVPRTDIWHIFDLCENGELILLDIDINKVNINAALLDRFKDDDINTLLKKFK